MASPASRRRPGFRCTGCGWASPRWVGRCGQCQDWGTVEAVATVPAATPRPGPVTAPARPIDEVDAGAAQARSTGLGELDRVLGSGLVPGGVVLVAGEPGVGKSTLLLDVAARSCAGGRRALYVTGEESAAQVRLRGDRIGAVAPGLHLAAETDLAAVLGHVDAVRPDLVVVDSVQTVASAEVEGTAGGVTQVRAVAAALMAVAKERDLPVLLVGHVTKDGAVAGPRALEHMVDVVLHFEGDQHARLRLVRATKNRFGAADEVGCFELGEGGLTEVPDPGGLFLQRRRSPVAGTCVAVTLEGRRPLAVEVQSLVVDAAGVPRRSTSGLDPARVALVVAALHRHVRLPLGGSDTFAATVGGVRVAEPAADLAVALALAGGYADVALPADLVAVGEVGLAGDVRPVPGVRRRLQEAARLGFARALVPPGCAERVDGIAAREVETLREAVGTAQRLGRPVDVHELRTPDRQGARAGADGPPGARAPGARRRPTRPA